MIRLIRMIVMMAFCALLFSNQAAGASSHFVLEGLPDKPHTSYPILVRENAPMDVIATACQSYQCTGSAEPFRWSPESGPSALGLLPGHVDGSAWAWSADGQTIAGFSQPDPSSHRGRTAVRWVGGGAPEALATHGESVETWARHITPDGSVIAGTWKYAYDELAFAWTESAGMIQLLDPSLPLLDLSYLTGLSDAGQIAATLRQDFSGASAARAVRWTEAGGVELLPLPSGFQSSGTEDIAETTGAIVGNLWTVNQYGSLSRAYLWTESGGTDPLPLPAGHLETDAQLISSDGTTVVGQFINAGTSALTREAFRWTSDDGIESMGPAPGFDETHVTAVSDDGSTISGYLRESHVELVFDGPNTYPEYEERTEQRAFVWLAGIGRVDLPVVEISPTCDHDPWQLISGTMQGGTVVFGRHTCREASSYYEVYEPGWGWWVDTRPGARLEEAFVWDEINGYRSPEAYVEEEFGVDLQGWSLDQLSVTDDGAILIGRVSLDHQQRAFILYLDAPPVPMADWGLLPLALAAVGWAVSRRAIVRHE